MTSVYHLTGDGSVFTTTNNGKTVYMARVSLKHAQTGKTLTVSGVGSTRKQAVERRDRNVEKRMAKLDPSLAPEDIPVAKTRLRARKQGLTPSQFLEVWEAIRGNSVKPQTKNLTRQRLTQWLFPWLDIPLEQLTTAQLKIHFNTTLPNAGAGPSSVYDCYGATKALLNAAVGAGYLKANPLNFIIKKPRPKVWDDDDKYAGKRISIFRALVKEVADPEHPNHEHYALILMMRLGLRRAEILGMRWDNITNLAKSNEAVLRLRQQLIYLTGEGYFIQDSLKTDTEDNKGRNIPLPETHRLALIELRKMKADKDNTPRATGLVFTDTDGDFLEYSKFGRIWERVLTDYMTKNGRKLKAGDLWRPHANRKLAATMMAQAGVPVKVAANILGHNPYVLLQTYDRPTRDDMRSAAQTLGDL